MIQCIGEPGVVSEESRAETPWARPEETCV